MMAALNFLLGGGSARTKGVRVVASAAVRRFRRVGIRGMVTCPRVRGEGYDAGCDESAGHEFGPRVARAISAGAGRVVSAVFAQPAGRGGRRVSGVRGGVAAGGGA